MEHAPETTRTDERVFAVSLVSSLLFAAFGIVIGILSGSQAVMIDGLYTAVSAPVALLSIHVVRMAASRATAEYPVGLVQARPLLELLQSLLLFGVLAGSVLEAVQILASGGRPLPADDVFLYAIASAVGCFGTGAAIAIMTRHTRSSLARLELKTWIKDGISSAIIAIVFTVATLGEGEWVQANARSIDQILVLAIGIGFAPGLLKTISRSARQLLLAAPPPATRRGVRRLLLGVLKRHGFGLRGFVTLALGGRLHVITDVAVPEQGVSIEAMSRFRSDLEHEIGIAYPDAVCRTSFFGADAQAGADSVS